MRVHKNPRRPSGLGIVERNYQLIQTHPYHNPRKKIKRQDVFVVGRELKSHRLLSLPCFLSLRCGEKKLRSTFFFGSCKTRKEALGYTTQFICQSKTELTVLGCALKISTVCGIAHTTEWYSDNKRDREKNHML